MANDESDSKKDTRKQYRFLAYLDEDQKARVVRCINDKFGSTEIDAATARMILLYLLNEAGY